MGIVWTVRYDRQITDDWRQWSTTDNTPCITTLQAYIFGVPRVCLQRAFTVCLSAQIIVLTSTNRTYLSECWRKLHTRVALYTKLEFGVNTRQEQHTSAMNRFTNCREKQRGAQENPRTPEDIAGVRTSTLLRRQLRLKIISPPVAYSCWNTVRFFKQISEVRNSTFLISSSEAASQDGRLQPTPHHCCGRSSFRHWRTVVSAPETSNEIYHDQARPLG